MLRAAAKSSVHGTSMTVAANDRAISFDSSWEPVSTTIISSQSADTDSKQARKNRAPFFTSMPKLTCGEDRVRRRTSELAARGGGPGAEQNGKTKTDATVERLRI